MSEGGGGGQDDLQTTVRKLRGELVETKALLESATAETARVRDEKARQKQRFEQQLADAEREVDAARQKLREERKSAQQRVYAAEEARTEAERQLKRAQKAAQREAAASSAAAPADRDTSAQLERALQDLAAAKEAAAQSARERDDLAAQLAAAKEAPQDAKGLETRCAELEDALADEREQCGALESMNRRLHAELDEREQQIDDLEEQLAGAKKELLASMTELDATAQELHALQQKAAESDGGDAQDRQALADAEARAAALEKDVEAGKERVAALEKELADARAANEALTHELEELRAQLADLQAQKCEEKEKEEKVDDEDEETAKKVAELEEKVAQLEAARAAQEAAAEAQLDAEAEQHAAALARLNAQLQQLQTELDEADERADAASMDQRRAELRSHDLEGEVGTLQEQIAELRAQAEAAKEGVSGEGDSDKAAAAEAELKRLQEEMKATEHDHEEEMHGMEKLIETLKGELHGAEEASEELHQQLDEQKRECAQTATERDELKQQIEDLKQQQEASPATSKDSDSDTAAELKRLQEEMKATEHDHEEEMHGMEKLIETLKGELHGAEEASEELHQQLDEQKRECAQTAAERDELKQQVADLKQQQEASPATISEDSDSDTAAELKRLQEEMKAAEHDHEEEMHGMEKLIETLKGELQSAEEASEELHQQLDEQKRACAQTATERDELKQQVADLKQARPAETAPDTEELSKQLAAANARIAELEAQLAQQQKEADESAPAQRQLLTGPRRTAAPHRRAPTRRTGAQLEGAVSMGPAGLTPDQLVLKKSSSSSSSGAEEAKEKEEEDEHVLIQVKGRRNVRSWVVEKSSASLNSGDVFILDAGDTIFQWNGRKCNRLERSKGVDIAARLKRARGGRARVVVIDEGAGADDEPEEASAFWAELGARDAVQSAEAGGEDTAVEAEVGARNRLYRYDAGADAYERVEGTRLLYEMLDAHECYLLDAGGELYVWNGRNSAPAARTANYRRACALLAEERATRPPWCTHVVKCRSGGGEPVLFMEKFANWPAEATLGVARASPALSRSAVAAPASAARREQVPVDVRALLAAEMPAPVPDVDGAADGPVEVWRVVDTARVPVAPARHGHFWSAHCYIVLYTWNLGGAVSDRSYIIYFWQGADATVSEQGTAAALSLSMGKSYRGASQVRVAQFAEPGHFHRIFHGALTIHCGTEPPEDSDQKEEENKSVHVFQVRGTEVADTSAVEVPPPATAAVLDTNDVFVVTRGADTCYVWSGTHSNSHARDTAHALARYLMGNNSGDSDGDSDERTPVEQTEGAEEPGFWAALGCEPPADEEAYASARVHPPGWVARAYVFTTKTGIVTAEPLWHYVQTDFVPEAMVLFDAYHSVYLWVGDSAPEKDKRVALETAVAYAAAAPELDPARGKMAVLQIGAGAEPLAFRCHFHCWLPPRPKRTGKARSRILGAALSRSEPPRPAPVAHSVEEALGEYSRTYTYEQLKDRAALPPTVDRSRLEMYLSDDDFATVFGITREQYLALPAWQRVPKKKQAGLF